MTHRRVGLGVAFVVAVTFLILGLAFVLPAGMAAYHEPVVTSEVQEEEETITLVAALQATVTDVSGGQGEVTVEFEDADSLETSNVTVGVEETESTTISDQTISVTIHEIDGGEASVSYQYPVSYGWPSSAQTLFGVLDVLIVTTLVLISLGYFVRVYG